MLEITFGTGSKFEEDTIIEPIIPILGLAVNYKNMNILRLSLNNMDRPLLSLDSRYRLEGNRIK